MVETTGIELTLSNICNAKTGQDVGDEGCGR